MSEEYNLTNQNYIPEKGKQTKKIPINLLTNAGVCCCILIESNFAITVVSSIAVDADLIAVAGILIQEAFIDILANAAM